jgi:hypothetical protein
LEVRHLLAHLFFPRSRCGITHLSVVAVSADAQELTIAVLEQAAEALQALCS